MEQLVWVFYWFWLLSLTAGFSPSQRPINSPNQQLTTHKSRLATRRHVRFSFLFNNGFGGRKNNIKQKPRSPEDTTVLEHDVQVQNKMLKKTAMHNRVHDIDARIKNQEKSWHDIQAIHREKETEVVDIPVNGDEEDDSSWNDHSMDIFDPSRFLEVLTGNNTNLKLGNLPILNETQLREALELLGPLTFSEPFLTLTNDSNTVNGSNQHNRRQPYVPPSIFENPHKFFSYTTLKLPPLPNSKTNTTTNATMIFPVNNNNVNSNNYNNNATIPVAVAALSSILNNDNATHNNNNTNNYYLIDPLSFLDSQANFTIQQLEAAQKIFYEYSTNATKQLTWAQKALLDYGAKALEETANSVSSGNNNNLLVNYPRTSTGLSVEELEAYLRLNGYVKQDDLATLTSGATPKRSSTGFLSVKSGTEVDPTTQQSVSTPKGRVAFPQPSILSYSKLKWGSTAAAALLGMIGGVTILPNLWLLGAVFGGLYGYETSKDLSETPPNNALAKVIVYLGRFLTKKYLWLYDFWQGLWFMYKTGQLSYDYWKKYAALDQQFAIQAKMDAWNARFQKGKENFDRWERENEVGRKILAGLRTVWLVEEKSKRKFGPKSRYRIVQWCYDGGRYTRKRVIALYSKRGKAIEELQAWALGMRQDLVDPAQWRQSIRPRIAAALAAVLFVNLTGALFSVSPLLLGMVAVVAGGIIWPTWFSEWLSRMGTLFEETKAKRSSSVETSSSSDVNRMETPKGQSSLPSKNSKDTPKIFAWPFMDKKEKERYHFYKRPDGSKRWYRTGGNPWNGNSNVSFFSAWGQRREEEEKPWWSLN